MTANGEDAAVLAELYAEASVLREALARILTWDATTASESPQDIARAALRRHPGSDARVSSQDTETR